jgi:hypothetical protein
MKIDLKTIKTYWINMSSNVERKTRMESLLSTLSFQNAEHFEGVKLDPNSHIKDGSGMATHTLLKKILRENSFPCLVLEDDVEKTLVYKDCFDVPDNCSALYLGVSIGGARGSRCVSTVVDENYMRVWNMLATHAVVYFDRKYVEEIVKRGEWFLNNNVPYDIGIGEIHRYFTILTPTYPVFYQSDPKKTSKFDVEWATRYQLHPLQDHLSSFEFPPDSSIYEIHNR